MFVDAIPMYVHIHVQWHARGLLPPSPPSEVVLSFLSAFGKAASRSLRSLFIAIKHHTLFKRIFTTPHYSEYTSTVRTLLRFALNHPAKGNISFQSVRDKTIT